jgi:predicted adenylyl cyclase CyaB
VQRTTDPAGLQEVPTAACGTRGVVRKRRRVFFVGATRVHLDRVEGLGEFVELEVALCPGQSANDGRAPAQQLMARLGISPDRLVDRAYVDLLLGKQA